MRDATLQATALRYAAGDLPPDESEAFESLLATDEAAQDALAEAVRLSAAAIGQAVPAPRPSFRDRVRERVRPRSPLAWAAGGAAAVAIATVVGLQLSPAPATPTPTERASPVVVPVPPPIAVAPEPRPAGVAVAPDPSPVPVRVATTAEIWAELSNTERIQKAHEDENRRRQRMRDIRPPTGVGIGMIDS